MSNRRADQPRFFERRQNFDVNARAIFDFAHKFLRVGGFADRCGGDGENYIGFAAFGNRAEFAYRISRKVNRLA